MPTKTNEYARPATPPDTSSLTEVRDASRECTACHLYKRATHHPSSLLRQPDEESRQREYKRFVADLRAAVKAAGDE